MKDQIKESLNYLFEIISFIEGKIMYRLTLPP